MNQSEIAYTVDFFFVVIVQRTSHLLNDTIMDVEIRPNVRKMKQAMNQIAGLIRKYGISDEVRREWRELKDAIKYGDETNEYVGVWQAMDKIFRQLKDVFESDAAFMEKMRDYVLFRNTRDEIRTRLLNVAMLQTSTIPSSTQASGTPWELVNDPVTGDRYWWNTETDEVKWMDENTSDSSFSPLDSGYDGELIKGGSSWFSPRSTNIFF